MKELRLQRAIDVVAAASALLAATGCGDSDDDGTPRAAMSEWCNAQKECDPDYFDDNWNSQSECVEEQLEYFDELESAECSNAATAFVSCYARSYITECDYSDTYDECEDEYEKYYEECYDDLYY